jgi:uncharacterized glyoxalase superfamily protein PhnB
MPHVIQTRSVLAVRNLAAATDHYVNVLGFTRDPIDAEGWSFLSLGIFKVMLGECRDAMPASTLGDHSYFVYVLVEGVDDYYDEVAGRGALIRSTPENKPWGLREFTLSTPDGHRMTIGELLKG